MQEPSKGEDYYWNTYNQVVDRAGNIVEKSPEKVRFDRSDVITTVYLTNKDSIAITPFHELFVQNKGSGQFVAASKLEEGSRLYMARGTNVVVDHVITKTGDFRIVELHRPGTKGFLVGRSGVIASSADCSILLKKEPFKSVLSAQGRQNLIAAIDQISPPDKLLKQQDFLNTLRHAADNDAQLLDFFTEGAHLSVDEAALRIRAWEVICNRPSLRKQVAVLEKALALLNSGYRQFDLTRVAYGNRLYGSSSTPALIEVFDNLLPFSRYQYSPGFDKVLDELEKGGNWHVGANWVVKFAGKGPLREAPASSISFEISTFSNDRVIDISYDDPPNLLLFIECKSVKPENALTSTHLRQFEADLSFVNSLDGIRWIFDGEKLPGGLDFTDFINSINVNQLVIDKHIGTGGTLEELKSAIFQMGENIFQIY